MDFWGRVENGELDRKVREWVGKAGDEFIFLLLVLSWGEDFWKAVSLWVYGVEATLGSMSGEIFKFGWYWGVCSR